MPKLWSSVAVCLIAVIGGGLPTAGAGATPSLATSAVAGPAAWVAFYSMPGDWVFGGVNQLIQQSTTTTFTASGTAAGVHVHATGYHFLDLYFSPIHGGALTVGSYVNAQRDPFNVNPGRPGMDIGGDGHGCNTVAGEFTVNDVAFDAGNLNRLDVTFVQHCEGNPAALLGEVSYNEPPTAGPVTIQARSLQFPPSYIGVADMSVPLWVTNPGATAVAVGAVSTSGMGASDVAISASTCPAVLAPAATCVVTVTVTPQAVGVRQSVIKVASASSSTTVTVTDTGIAGNAAFILDSEPGEWIGAAQQLSFNQFNSTISGGGTPSQVGLSLTTADGHWFNAVLAAPPGQTLQVGDYPEARLPNPPTAGHPGLDISGDSRGCSNHTGQFNIREIVFDGSGNLIHFAADAMLQCDGGVPTLFASLRLGSTVPYIAVGVKPASAQLTFPDSLPEFTSVALPVTITNAGLIPFPISSGPPTITGPNASNFRVSSSTCATLSPLNPGASCTVSVTFTPHGLGDRHGSVVVDDGTARGHHTVALTGTGTVPRFTYPFDGPTVLTAIDTNLPFSWTTVPQAQAYYMVVGTTIDGYDLVNSGVLPPTQSSLYVPALPSGPILHAKLLAEVRGVWTLYGRVTFGAAPSKATFTSPVNGQLSVDSTEPFTWSPTPHAEGYLLVVGTSQYAQDLLNSGVLPPTQTAFLTPALPAGKLLYAAILTKVNGAWIRFQAVTFTAGPPMGSLSLPVNGQLNVVTPTAFTWSAASRATAYYLVVGTTLYGADLVNSGTMSSSQTSFNVSHLPPGKVLYATLLSMINGNWVFQVVRFTAA